MPNFAQQQPTNAQSLQGKGLDGRDLAGFGNKNLALYADNSALQRQGAQGLGQDLGSSSTGLASAKDLDGRNLADLKAKILLARI